MIFARFKTERGQAFVLTALAMVMLCGMAALVLDVGNWFRDKRRLQGTWTLQRSRAHSSCRTIRRAPRRWR